MAKNRAGSQISKRQTLNSKQETETASLQEITATALTESAFPLATEIERYEKAVPGSGNRLIDISEQQTKEIYALYREEKQASTSLTSRGQIFIFIAVMTALITAGCVGVWGNWVAASVIGFVPTAFVAILASTGMIDRLKR